MPKTPIHGFRIPAELFAAAAERAEIEGRTLSDVVRLALLLYVDRGLPQEEAPASPNNP